METYLFRIDWLHAVDAGVGADLAGNVLEALLHKFPGNNRKLGARLSMKSCRGSIDAMTLKIDLRTSAIYHSRRPNQPNLPN